MHHMIDLFDYLTDGAYDPVLWNRIWNECKKLYSISDSLRMEVFEHAVFHFKEGQGNMMGYLIHVAQGLKKSYNKHEVATDTLELTKTIDDTTNEREYDSIEEMVENRVLADYKYDVVCKYALSSKKYFLLYAKGITSSNYTKNFFPTDFKMETNRLFTSQKLDFHKNVKAIYKQYAKSFADFLSSPNIHFKEIEKTNLKMTKSISLGYMSDEGSFIVSDTPDLYLDRLRYRGNIKNKRVIRVPVADVKDKLFTLIDSRTSNAMKFYMGSHYIFKSLGGSISMVDIPDYNWYGVIEDEIACNLCLDLKAQLIANDSDSVYLLQKPLEDGTYINTIPHRVFGNVDIDFEYKVLFEG